MQRNPASFPTKKSKKTSKNNRKKTIATNPERAEYFPLTADLRRFGMTKPSSVIVKLRWDFNKTINNVGTLKASISFNANGIYDIDPALASTAMAGFVEWHAFYQTNRVLRSRMRAYVSNTETQPIQVVFLWVPSAVAANAFAPNMYGNRWAKEILLAPKGGIDTKPVNHAIEIAELFGADYVYGDLENFCGTSGSNPVTLANFCIGIQPVTGVLVSGVAFTGFFEFDVEFSGSLLNVV